jgi:hypothetical protein
MAVKVLRERMGFARAQPILRAEHHPSRRVEDDAYLTGERNCVHPGDDGRTLGRISRVMAVQAAELADYAFG